MITALAQTWRRFWHEPLPAQRLAYARILFALALFSDQLCQYWPNLDDFYGPHGIAPAGLMDDWALRVWNWPMLIFNTDDMNIVVPLFWTWVAATFLFLVGWQTRVMSVFVWFLTFAFHSRNPSVLNFGDNFLRNGLFLLMISPCGRALSIDAWLRHRRQPVAAPETIPAWPVRLFQIQLCIIYFATGLCKLVREPDWFTGSWWDGTSLHYVMNMVTRTRWSYAQAPIPFWLSASLTYVVVAWEVLFPVLVLSRYTRKWALWFGVLFHLGILITLEIGWFGFYSLAMYGVWIDWPRSASGGQQSALSGQPEKTKPAGTAES